MRLTIHRMHLSIEQLGLGAALAALGYFLYEKYRTMKVDPTMSSVSVTRGARLQPTEAPVTVQGNALARQNDGTWLATAPGSAAILWTTGLTQVDVT